MSAIGGFGGKSTFARSAFSPAAVSSADTLDTLRAGIDHVRAGRYGRAIERLTPLFQDDPAYVDPEKGSVAYWLGRAYLEDAKEKSAYTIWRSGIREWRNQERILDIRLADVYIRSVSGADIMSGWGLAEAAYLQMLERVNRTEWEALSDGVRERLARHVRELAVVLPEAVQRRTGITVDPLDLDVSVNPEGSAGEALAGWWRSQDPLPATDQNERLREHLQRVVRARDRFELEGRLDDRGKVFIQLGEPREVTRVRLAPSAEAAPHQANVRIRDNEFWTYPDVDQKAYFLFVDEGSSRYEVGGVDMLFPPEVRTGIDRSFDFTLSYLKALQRVLRQLANYHEDFGLRASEAVDATQAALTQSQFGIVSEEDPAQTHDPGSQARELRLQNQRKDQANASKRAARLPNSHSTVGATDEELPIQTRIARFLTEDGDTRVEVAWQVKPSAGGATSLSRDTGADESPTSLLTFTGVQETHDHVVEGRTQQRHFVLAAEGPPQPYTFETTVQDSIFHLAMQWDQHNVREKNGDDVGSVLRRHTERRDSLVALRNDPKRLEMSDLKPLAVPDGAPAEDIPTDEAVLYPLQRVEADQPLAIVFEVYHLRYDSNDRSQYTVSYKVESRTERGGLLGLFGGEDREQTVTTTTYQGETRREREHIQLDLGNILDEKEGQIKVTVRVTDEIAGQDVDRSISFEATGPEGE